MMIVDIKITNIRNYHISWIVIMSLATCLLILYSSVSTWCALVINIINLNEVLFCTISVNLIAFICTCTRFHDPIRADAMFTYLKHYLMETVMLSFIIFSFLFTISSTWNFWLFFSILWLGIHVPIQQKD